MMYEQKYRLQRGSAFSGVKKCCTGMIRSAIIKKARQDEQENQTTTTNLIKSKTICPFIKKKLRINIKVKIASDKTQTEQNNL